MIVGQLGKEMILSIKSEIYFYAVLIHLIYSFYLSLLFFHIFNKFISMNISLKKSS